jgi:hypothetical protein
MKKRPEDQSVTVVGNADNIRYSPTMKRIAIARLLAWDRRHKETKPGVRK